MSNTDSQAAVLNKNFLLAFINTTVDSSLRAKTFLNGSGEIVSVCCLPHNEAACIPTLAQFKIFTALLSFSQQTNSKSLEFKCVSRILKLVGLSITEYNYTQLYETLINFSGLIIQFKNSFERECTAQLVKSKENFEMLNFTILEQISIEEGKVKIDFNPHFLAACSTGLVQDLHLEKLKKIKSPKTMQLYLWLLNCSKRRNLKSSISFNKKELVDTNFLFNQLGWKKPDEESDWSRPGRMLQQVRSCLDEIKAIDSGFKDFRITLEKNKTKFLFEKKSTSEN